MKLIASSRQYSWKFWEHLFSLYFCQTKKHCARKSTDFNHKTNWIPTTVWLLLKYVVKQYNTHHLISVSNFWTKTPVL